MKLICFLLPFLLFFSGCGKQFSDSRMLMDTYVEIKIAKGNIQNVDSIWNELETLVKQFNRHDKNSEISKINRNAGIKSIKVSPTTLNLLKTTIQISKLTDGIFDPTITPLLKLWGSYAKNRQIPPKSKILKTRKSINYKNISIRHDKVFLKKRKMSIDLGGIAKGYIVDNAVELLVKNGALSGMVNAGGDIRTFGKKKWKIGIQDPRNDKKILTTLKIQNKAIATSGDYERYFVKDGKRYHHIIDPHTGYPADKSMACTIIAPTAMLADALATTVFILGHEKGFELLKDLPGTEAIVIDTNGNLHKTAGLSNVIN